MAWTNSVLEVFYMHALAWRFVSAVELAIMSRNLCSKPPSHSLNFRNKRNGLHPVWFLRKTFMRDKYKRNRVHLQLFYLFDGVP